MKQFICKVRTGQSGSNIIVASRLLIVSAETKEEATKKAESATGYWDFIYSYDDVIDLDSLEHIQ